jgi:hypothetical protein
LLEGTVIGYDDHSRKEYYEGRKDFRELLRVRAKLRRNTLDREGEKLVHLARSREDELVNLDHRFFPCRGSTVIDGARDFGHRDLGTSGLREGDD